MNNIPTAEEFAKTHHPMKTYPVDHQMMIEFAKLHVQAALKSAADEKTYGMLVVPIFNEEQQKYILNSYPLTNIK